MKLPGIICRDCGREELISVIPGTDGDSTDLLYRLTPAYPDYALCWDCWVRRFVADKPTPTKR